MQNFRQILNKILDKIILVSLEYYNKYTLHQNSLTGSYWSLKSIPKETWFWSASRCPLMEPWIHSFLNLPASPLPCMLLCTDRNWRAVLRANCSYLFMQVLTDMFLQEGRLTSFDWPLCPRICHLASVSVSETRTFVIHLLLSCDLPI